MQVNMTGRAPHGHQHYFPEGITHGPFSFRGEKVNFKCKNSLMIFGTLHHHGSIIGFRKDLGSLSGKGA